MTAKPWDLRVGDWRTALADVAMVDAVICDPPYSERVHNGHNRVLDSQRNPTRHVLDYPKWGSPEVGEFCRHWAPRTRRWFVALTSHDLWPEFERELSGAGMYVFHPIPCCIPGMSVRLSGDGPSSWSVWAVVARHRSRDAGKWGALPGAYWVGRGELSSNASSMIGGKPVSLMRAIVRDYTRPGDLVCDPCAGSGTTLIAACKEGRRAIGSELDPTTALRAVKRLLHADLSPPLFPDVPRGRADQLSLDTHNQPV